VQKAVAVTEHVAVAWPSSETVAFTLVLTAPVLTAVGADTITSRIRPSCTGSPAW
jgi:hypothetical protein